MRTPDKKTNYSIQCEHMSGAYKRRLAVRQGFQVKYWTKERQRRGHGGKETCIPETNDMLYVNLKRKKKEHGTLEELKKIQCN